MVRQEVAQRPPARLKRVVAAVGWPASSFFRRPKSTWKPPGPAPKPLDPQLSESVRQVALAYPWWGYKRIAVICRRQGLAVSNRFVYRVLQAADLLQRFSAQAGRVTVALSTALGNPNHIALARVIQGAGGDIRAPKLRVFDSALDALDDVLSRHADVAAITAASAVDALAGNKARALAVSAPARLSGLYANTPTWAEHAVDCMIGAWRGVTGPSGLSAEQVRYWQSILDSAVATDVWRADLDRHFWTGMYFAGAALEDYLQRETAEFRATLGELQLLRA